MTIYIDKILPKTLNSLKSTNRALAKDGDTFYDPSTYTQLFNILLKRGKMIKILFLMAFLSIFFWGAQSLIDKFEARPSQPQNES